VVADIDSATEVVVALTIAECTPRQVMHLQQILAGISTARSESLSRLRTQPTLDGTGLSHPGTAASRQLRARWGSGYEQPMFG
jgi:hypothetical protein